MVLEDPMLIGLSYTVETSGRQPPTGGDGQDSHIVSHCLQPNFFEGVLDIDERLVPIQIKLTSTSCIDHHQ